MSKQPEKKWIIAPAAKPEFFEQFPEIQPFILQLLHNRGLHEQQAIDSFLNPDYQTDVLDPFLYIDMEKAVKRILQGIEKHEKLLVYGDYDADGVSSTAVLYSVLKELGANVEVYIPFRETEGYGLNMNAVNEFIASKIELLITVDCAVSNVDEVAALKKGGVDVIVTDHHQEPLKLPEPDALINHNTSRDTYPYKYLAGCGVAFKLAQGLLARHKDYDVKQVHDGWEKWLLDLVAMGTISDMMPLVGENRALVTYGLVVLQKTKRIGLHKLFEIIGKSASEITEETVGFQIGPRLNAAGRLNHASTAYQLLVTEDPIEAQQLAEEINQTNTTRQRLTENITKEALQDIGDKTDEPLLAVVGKDWPTGLVGLVAGRISNKFYRPTFIISHFRGEIIGSGRSIEGFNMTDGLQKLEEHLDKYGGHAQACGFTIKDESHIEPFLEGMRKLAEEKMEEDGFKPQLDIDAELKIGEITWEAYKEIQRFAPFGVGNKRPVFVSHNVEVRDCQTIGKTDNHLRLRLTDGSGVERKAVAFGFGSLCEKINESQKIDVAYEIDVNQWNGNQELQLRVVDIKI